MVRGYQGLFGAAPAWASAPGLGFYNQNSYGGLPCYGNNLPRC